MTDYLSIGEAAKAVHTTSETPAPLRPHRLGEAEQKGRMDELPLLHPAGPGPVKYGPGPAADGFAPAGNQERYGI